MPARALPPLMTFQFDPLVVSLSECRNVFHVVYIQHVALKGLRLLLKN